MSSVSRSEFKQQIQHIDPIDFEEFVADVWSHRGWKTSLTSASHDRGIDVIAVTDGVVSRKEAIQVKRYQSDKITSREVREYASIPNQEGDIDNVIIVTSSSFSQPAQEVADDLNVKTVDADDLYTIITENGLFPSLSEYITVPDNFETDNDKKTTPRSTENRESKRVSGQNRNDKTKKHSDSAPVAGVNESSETTSSLSYTLAILGVVAILLIAGMTVIGLFPLDGGGSSTSSADNSENIVSSPTVTSRPTSQLTPSSTSVSAPTVNQTLVVDNNKATEYSSIQTAIDNASTGDTVEIRPGTYAEAIVVDKNITLTAPDGATLDGSMTDDSDVGITIGDEFELDENASPTIRGITITRYDTGIKIHTDGDWAIDNVIVRTTRGDGIDASDSIGDWTIRDAKIISPGKNGINAFDSTGDWIIKDTIIRGVDSDGISSGIEAAFSTDDWTMRNISVDGGISAGHTGGNWVIKQSSVKNGIRATESDGRWIITDSVVTGNIPLSAPESLGEWRITHSVINETSSFGSVINAEDTTAEGIAEDNWWGNPSGPDVDACVGNVDCSDPLTKRPRGVGFNSSDEE